MTSHPAPPADQALVWGIVILAAIVLSLPLLLPAIHHWARDARGSDSERPFYEIPYVTWFITHFTVATLAILVVALLAVTSALNAAATAGLISGIVGYVLGSAGRQQHGQAPPTRPPDGS